TPPNASGNASRTTSPDQASNSSMPDSTACSSGTPSAAPYPPQPDGGTDSKTPPTPTSPERPEPGHSPFARSSSARRTSTVATPTSSMTRSSPTDLKNAQHSWYAATTRPDTYTSNGDGNTSATSSPTPTAHASNP